MEGPTPVSALIHAATLVTAGIFLMIRCSAFLECSNTVLSIMTLLGSLTCFFSATVGLVQNDIKRVIAYSTCSQLGYMLLACGLSSYSVALFHLANHAVFKALLFLSSGCVIHGLSNEQDLRRFGGLLNFYPITYAMFLIGSLALIGFPFLTGFYSKDFILELAGSKHLAYSNFGHCFGCLAAFCTAYYSVRLVLLTFVNRNNSYRIAVIGVHDGGFKMLTPLLILSFGSIFIGFLSRDVTVGPGCFSFQNAIFILPHNLGLIDAEFLNTSIKNIPL